MEIFRQTDHNTQKLQKSCAIYAMVALLLLCVIMFSACSFSHEKLGGRHGLFTPSPMFMNLPQDDSDYSQGFRDGCNQAISITGSGLMRMHGWQYDVNRGIENKDYYSGFRAGTSACVYYLDYEIF